MMLAERISLILLSTSVRQNLPAGKCAPGRCAPAVRAPSRLKHSFHAESFLGFWYLQYCTMVIYETVFMVRTRQELQNWRFNCEYLRGAIN